MRDSTKLGATLVIWVTFTIMISAIMTTTTGPVSTMDGPALLGVVMVLALAAVVSTGSVWLLGRSAPAEDASRAAKLKRSGRSNVARLVESLDDDEIYELESLLLSREDDPRRASRGR